MTDKTFLLGVFPLFTSSELVKSLHGFPEFTVVVGAGVVRLHSSRRSSMNCPVY